LPAEAAGLIWHQLETANWKLETDFHMGAEIELTEGEAANIFSTRRIRARLATAGKSVAAFRETLAWGRNRLYGLFEDGTPADLLVRARSFLVDEVLHEAWLRFLPELPNGLSLVAVGGYGRGELLPHSDIDILLLHGDHSLETHRSALEQFNAFCWDIGLEIGSSVRTIEDCAKLAADDVTIITNLMESRLLAGDPLLFAAMQDALKPEHVWPVEKFFRAKLAEQQARHRKYDDTGYKLEPNVKESPGGLRDIHTIGWVAKRHFGAQTLTELRERGFLTKQECDELFAGQDLLWRIRFALHMITGRREDRLLFDHQVKVADLFGYVDEDPNRAVEQFMQLYYRTIKALSCLNDMLLQLFEEAILRSASTEQPQPLNERFQIRGGVIEVTHDDVFRRDPVALAEIFLLLQQHPEIDGISAQTLRLIRRDRKLLDQWRDNLRMRETFVEMFREGAGLTRSLRRMNRYGILGRYLPEFGRVVGHMQYDLFHTLTVDEHLLFVVRNLRRFAMPRFRHELPMCSELMARIPKRELLYFAGLFHDMAKGRGGDHSELGAGDAERFCLDHGFSHTDAELVAWLVKHHLLMSLTAQKQDVSDPQVVIRFAQIVGSREHLEYLYLLTCADIRGTNPALWNSWRESLLNDLYKSAARALERGLHNPVDQRERVAEQRAQALELLAGSGGGTREDADRVWSRFENDYFLRHSPQELAWHLPQILKASDADLPLILVKALADRGTTVFIYCRDRDHLFGLTTGVLARLGLNILDARLNTTDDDYVLDSYVVMEGDGTPITQQIRFTEIADSLRKVLADPNAAVIDVNRRLPQRLRHFTTPTLIYFSQDAARGRTILEVVTGDRPGLLSLIGRVFHARGILLDAAKIATIGERAEDVFYITDKAHRPITEEAELEALREDLTIALVNPPA
jgi:[protein-PII] uridylyltransferase